MSYKIKYLSLQKAELEYEVGVRGGSVGENVQDLRKQIVKLAPEHPPEDVLESHLEASVDLAQVKDTLSKTNEYINNLKSRYDKNVYSRTETILHHVYYRLIRINRADADDSIYIENSQVFRQQFQELKRLKVEAPSTSSNSEPLADLITVNCEKRLASDVVGKLKYSGKSCVRSFIQRAEELVVSRGMSKDKLLTFAYEIFTDDALHWFRCIKDRVETWDDLVKLLRQDFSQADYDYRLLAEIRMRTQGEQENISIYISIMHGMFSRLNKPLSEEDMLEIILHNIRPTYASVLASSPNIISINSLRDLCRSYENIQARMTQFREPPKVTSETVAREFAYTRPSTSTSFARNYTTNGYNSSNQRHDFGDKSRNYRSYANNGNTNYVNKRYSDQPRNMGVNALVAHSNTNTKKLYCPRCRVDTHSLSQCQKPHFAICFKCGKEGVRYPDCLECNPANKKN
jgi:hypothetical protein